MTAAEKIAAIVAFATGLMVVLQTVLNRAVWWPYIVGFIAAVAFLFWTHS